MIDDIALTSSKEGLCRLQRLGLGGSSIITKVSPITAFQSTLLRLYFSSKSPKLKDCNCTHNSSISNSFFCHLCEMTIIHQFEKYLDTDESNLNEIYRFYALRVEPRFNSQHVSSASCFKDTDEKTIRRYKPVKSRGFDFLL